jgi:hypothetical protein
MSAAFQLDFTGPRTPCGFPGCIRKSFHEGEHEFMSEQENTERLFAAATSYGVGTRSYNRSGEKRELERQRRIAAARYEAEPHREVLILPMCTCAQRPYPHEVSIHKNISRERPGVYLDYYGTAIRFAPDGMRWPWSLRFVGNGGEM